MRSGLSALALAIAAAACNCNPSFHNATYACHTASECANGYTCVGGICVSTAVGGGAGGGGMVDSGCVCLTCETCVNGACVTLDAGSEPAGCGAYRCDGTNKGCPVSCTATGDCIDGADCIGSECTATLQPGASCTKDAACLSGHCADGVCCDQACAGPCDVCNTAAAPGTCVVAPAGAPGDPVCAPYFCPGDDAGCSTSCHADNECAGSSLCVDGVCQPLPNGSPCMAGAQCSSTFCVDGRCCASACTGSCDHCDDQLSPGNCVPYTGGSPGSPPCGPFLCNGIGTQCPSTCFSGSECSATGFCDGGSCLNRRDNGQPCLGDKECLSDHCVAGMCCGSDCTGGCFSCNQPGDAGNCLPIPPGSDPAAACPGAFACDGDGGCFNSCTTTAGCESGALCYQNQCVTDLPIGAACMGASECHSGLCEQGFCCDRVCGACSACNTPGKEGTCVNALAGTDPSAMCAGGLTCDGDGGCFGACSASAKCETGYTCDGGACQKSGGTACDAGTQCASGFCTDGVCCNSTCTGQCKSCNRPGSLGACVNIGSGQDPDQECNGGLACNGSGSCSTSCNGMGSCEATYQCVGGNCMPKLANGVSCGSAGQCLSGFCRDTVCCATSCTSLCERCNVNGSLGTCVDYARGTDPDLECGVAYQCAGDAGCLTKCALDTDCKTGFGCSDAGTCLRKNGQGCVTPSACLSGQCVDGRCCNTACSGACDNCNLATPGTCSNEPTGYAGAPACAPFVCNGSASCPTSCMSNTDCVAGATCMNGACLLPNGSACSVGTQCSSMHCVDNACCNTACNGTCQTCATGACTPIGLRTDPANECGTTYCNGMSGCISPCGSDTDCKSGNYCNGSSCVPKQGPGAMCTKANECQSGHCTDGVCCDSDCLGTCMTCSRVVSGTCSPAAAATDPDGECGLYWCTGMGTCFSSCVDGSVCKSGICAMSLCN